ncbi:hypothetical protein Mgra_00007547 [Meloidogyne graminicola]|uniref:Uncharacterized protein n=1 Tax=Meloidogyne graminicola TaxID=189291 RepID=A0A8S9ZI51_9BILA|nr:hypothetical protein Mgra_00007547 [Meloidogyne graminicola]
MNVAVAKPKERQFQVVPVPAVFTRGRWECVDYKECIDIKECIDYKECIDSKDEALTGGAAAIDNKIEKAMDLVKTHLTYAVREEVETLRSTIADLETKVKFLENENQILRQFAPPDIISTLVQQQNISSSNNPPGSVVEGIPPNMTNINQSNVED